MKVIYEWTGIKRLPKRGECFVSIEGERSFIEKAEFGFKKTRHWILRRVEIPEAQEGAKDA